jgi:hypothetical protein
MRVDAAARLERLRSVCCDRRGRTDERQVALVSRMLYDPTAPLVEVRPSKRARLHVPGDLASPRWLAWTDVPNA